MVGVEQQQTSPGLFSGFGLFGRGQSEEGTQFKCRILPLRGLPRKHIFWRGLLVSALTLIVTLALMIGGGSDSLLEEQNKFSLKNKPEEFVFNASYGKLVGPVTSAARTGL